MLRLVKVVVGQLDVENLVAFGVEIGDWHRSRLLGKVADAF